MPAATPQPALSPPTGRAFSGIQSQILQNQQDLDKRLAPIQAEKAQATGALEQEISKPLPEAPQLQQIPQFQPRHISQQEAMNFSGIAMAFAALASLKTREPFAAALNAAGDAMKGFQQGNLQQAKIDIENFNAQSRAAIAQNQQLMQQYNAVLENRKLSMTQKQSMLSVIAAKEQDEIALSTLKENRLDLLYKLMDSRQRADQAFQLHKDQMAQTLAIARDRLDVQKQNLALREKMWGGAGGTGPGGLSDLGTEYLAAYMQLNGRMPIGMSRNNPAAWSVMNRLAEEAQAAGLSPQEWAAAGPLTHQKLAAFGKLYQMRNAVEAFDQMLELNGGILKSLSDKVDRTGSPYANKSILWLRQNAINDPAVSEYLAQIEIFLPEVARVLNNPNLTGQLTDTSRDEMRQVLSQNLPPAAVNRVVDRVISDGRNRIRTLEDQSNKVIDEIKHPTEAVGDKKPKASGGPSQEDLEFTAKKYGITVDEVKRRLGIH